MEALTCKSESDSALTAHSISRLLAFASSLLINSQKVPHCKGSMHIAAEAPLLRKGTMFRPQRSVG